MKNFTVDHMQENGAAKKTLSRKEYDEQLKLRFAAMEDEKHEKLSAQAKEEFEQKTEAEKQEFMNTINDVENKPLTYDLIKALEEHKDLTFYCLATTGLNTADKKKTIKNGNGYEEKFIQKDEPTYFMAETYHYDERQKAYVPSDSIAVFIEASKEVVDRAIEQANAGGYDVFANADFNLDDYLAGKNVKTKDEAKAVIGEYFDKASSGIVLCYGEFHDNMLRGNDFPIPEDSLDLNRVMGEQGTFGTASLGKCVNQILKADKTNALELSSTTEKLAADVICLNRIASLEMDEPVKIQVREELIDKFSDKDRELILGADESVRLTVKPRMRQRRPMGPDNMRERLHRRDMGHNIPERDVPDADSHRGTDPKGADAPRGFVRRQPRTEITAEQTSERQQNAQASERKRLTKRRNPAMEMSEGQPKGPEKQPEGQVFFGSREEKPEAPEITDEDIMDFFEDQADAASVTEKTMPDERTTPERATPERTASERTEAEQLSVDGPSVDGASVDGTSDDASPQSRDEKRIETPSVSLQDAEALKTAGMGMLLQALMRQNELLQERNEISMKQNEIESAKIAEMQKQTELMERQAKQMEQLTVLMDNLTKVYSMSEVERLKMDAPILPIPAAEAPGKGAPAQGKAAPENPSPRGPEMPARRGGLAKRHPDGYYANAGRQVQANTEGRDGSRIVDPRRVIESRRQAEQRTEEKDTKADNTEDPAFERGQGPEKGRPDMPERERGRKPEGEPDGRTKSVAEQARELKGSMDAVLEGLMNPDGHEMSVEEPVRRSPRGRIKEDDDIGRP